MAKDDKDKSAEVVKTLLVETPEGKGFFLTIQNVYVSSRPYVVENNSQVQIAANRNCLKIIGTTKMTDEAFQKAYVKDPAAAVAKAVANSDEVNKDAVKASQAKAEKAAKEAEARKQAEAKRLNDEAAKRIEEEKAHQAVLAKAKAETQD